MLSCTQRRLQRADAYYYNSYYKEAIPLYEKVLKHKKQFPELKLKLAKSYRENYSLDKAEAMYASIVKEDTLNIGVKYNYAEVLRLNGNCKEATRWYHAYQKDCHVKFNPEEDFCEADKRSNAKDYKAIVDIIDLKAKSKAYAAVKYENGFVFLAPQRDRKSKFSASFDDFFYAEQDDTKTIKKVEALSPNLNSSFQEGPFTFNKEETEIYFTHSIEENLEILHAVKRNGVWAKPSPFKYNNKQYSVGHPSLSADGEKLYFASNMPGGYGGVDLYVCTKDGANWSPPLNLGPAINTANDESFPHIFNQNGNDKLYFSSNSKDGFGAGDVYFADVNDKEFTNITLLPFPLNSYYNDFAISFDETGRKGFLASDRPNEFHTHDALYQLTLLPRIYIKGKIVNEESAKPLSGIVVDITKKGSLMKVSTVTDSSGAYGFEVELDQFYTVRAKTEGYFSNEFAFNTVKKNKPETMLVNIALKELKLEKIIEQKTIVLRNVYYDYNKATVRQQSIPELNRLVKILQDNPEITIELGAHTDSRGPAIYNQDLSDRRAKAVVSYVIKAGIHPNRIRAIGYGEQHLLNKCADGIPCTKANHALNRRTEFKVTSIQRNP